MQNIFTGSRLDRVGAPRKDAAWVAERLRRPSTLVSVMGGGGHLVHEVDGDVRVALRRQDEAPRIEDHPWVLLGLLDGEAVVAIDAGEGASAPAGHRFEELRPLGGRLPADEAALLAQARGLLNWRRTHRFCPRCGGACRPIEAGYVMECLGCGTHQFPRTDPAVIMLVRHGDRALLARAPRFEGRMFSTLAGFVEPGESLEEAVVREVAEECGVHVTGVRYHSSQPWPFPASVMLGFTAETADDRLTIDGDEIAEAAFFTREEVRDRERQGFSIPPRLSIARQLIEDWLGGEHRC